MKKQVTIYTDGACSGNPGPGGWGCVLMYNQHKKESSGGAEDTTNNRMEITAALEALKLLKERGLVDSRNGMGSYVTKPEAGNLADVIYRMAVLDKISYAEIYDVRKILEIAACREAASSVRNDQLAEMNAYLEKLKDRSISVKERRELDYNFHAAIAEASGNRLLGIMVRTTRNVFIAMIEKGIFTEGGIEDAILRHDRIMQALINHDPAAAEKAMQEHLDQSYENVVNYMSQRAGQET